MGLGNSLPELRRAVHDLRQEAAALRRQLAADAEPPAAVATRLPTVEQELAAAERTLWQAEARAGGSGLIVNTATQSNLLGPDTTGLEVKVHLRMAHVPTGTYHLLDAATRPLVVCEVRNADPANTRRLRVASYIEGYSATAVDTVEIPKRKTQEFKQLPTLFPERIRTLNELTRASLNVLVEDLDGSVELHRTSPLWLLARNTAPLDMKDPTSGDLVDMTPYLGAFVTPNEPSIVHFLRKVAARHPNRRLVAYQDAVFPQVQALFEALKQDAQITYVNSLTAFDPTEGSGSQRVRLPRESLGEGQANCIDGVVLFASLLEAMSLNAALVFVPGHALVAWEEKAGSEEWSYVETVELGTQPFATAQDHGQRYVNVYKKLLEESGDVRHFRQWAIRDLRARQGIFPME